MRYYLILFLVLFCVLDMQSQNSILYDLDSYRRVNIDNRVTTISPFFDGNYSNKLHTPGGTKSYNILLGANYFNDHLINTEKNQKTITNTVRFNGSTGTAKKLDLDLTFSSNNRTYSNNKYFKSGYKATTRTLYRDRNLASKDFFQTIDLTYDIGFGFGRLELINNAWVGARILEELDKNGLLEEIPEPIEMELFFDRLGDLEYERVLDPRLRDIYVLENLIRYLEEKEWIEKGSIPAFVIINDAYRYENVFNRFSGERLEFTLSPEVYGTYRWIEGQSLNRSTIVIPGFEGEIEYQIHTNGDLAYYTRKSIRAKLGYFDEFPNETEFNRKVLRGNLYFVYNYRYIPSLRTNLEVQTYFTGQVEKRDKVSANVNFTTNFNYYYYLSPATQLVLSARLQYYDDAFQAGEYQPFVSSSVNFNIIHAIR